MKLVTEVRSLRLAHAHSISWLHALHHVSLVNKGRIPQSIILSVVPDLLTLLPPAQHFYPFLFYVFFTSISDNELASASALQVLCFKVKSLGHILTDLPLCEERSKKWRKCDPGGERESEEEKEERKKVNGGCCGGRRKFQHLG